MHPENDGRDLRGSKEVCLSRVLAVLFFAHLISFSRRERNVRGSLVVEGDQTPVQGMDAVAVGAEVV